jgi:hypothetical protein
VKNEKLFIISYSFFILNSLVLGVVGGLGQVNEIYKNM